MIIEYDSKYDEEIKNLLIELQEHICSIDKLGYNILGKDFGDLYFKKVMDEVNKCEGKILLYKNNARIVGLVVGLINNECEDRYDFKVPRRGRITELVVSKNFRSKGIGTVLLKSMEEYLKSVDCSDILLGVFGYNTEALKFYEKNGYHVRLFDMTKADI